MVHARRAISMLVVTGLMAGTTRADDLLFAYEATVLPHAPGAGWPTFNPCANACTESVEDGHYVLRWTPPLDFVGFLHIISRDPEPRPSTLWVEWSFRSNHPLGPFSYGCDGVLTINFVYAHELVNMYGDAAISFSGDKAVIGMNIAEFHSYRFESLDGVNYTVAVDGSTFIVDDGFSSSGAHYIQFGGRGGCLGDEVENPINEWDFIRYGTISFGERIVGTEPTAGFLNSETHGNLTSFTVTFDSPNYAYVDEITVDVSGCSSLPNDPCTSAVPKVIATRRLDNGPPDVVEIVLDRPIPAGKRTRFIFDDGVMINKVSYTYIHGDSDADDDMDIFDFAVFQNCFGDLATSPLCPAFDFDEGGVVDLVDFAEIHPFITGPNE